MSKHVTTPTALHDDGKFIRTSIVLTGGSNEGSIAIVNKKGEQIALLNIFTNEDNSWFAVDVIDPDKKFDKHAALVFEDGKQQRLNASGIVAADFRKVDNAT